MKTARLFKEDVYLKETDAEILQVSAGKEGALVVLDRTVFFPTGGGQSCDTGYLGGLRVKEVYEYDGEIYHVVEDAASLSPGDRVHLQIDWERRFDNMQRHCGEHILSGVFHSLCGGVNRGFHMGDDYMTIDISLEDDPSFTEINDKLLSEAELKCNRIIWADMPVVSRHFDSREEAESLPLRKKLSIESDITIVSVGDINNPSDCVACCGTHPSTSGQVGMVKIYKAEPNKGMYRIYFEAGQRALMKYRNQFNILTELERDLSAGDDDVLHKYEALKDRLAAVKDEVYHLKKALIRQAAEDIKGCSDDFIAASYELLEPGDFTDLYKALGEDLPKLLALIYSPSHTAALFSASPEINCGKLIKEHAPESGGRGGGSASNGRAVFPSGEALDRFIEVLKGVCRNE